MPVHVGNGSLSTISVVHITLTTILVNVLIVLKWFWKAFITFQRFGLPLLVYNVSGRPILIS